MAEVKPTPQDDDVVTTNEKGEPVKNPSPPIFTAAELAAIRREADR